MECMGESTYESSVKYLHSVLFLLQFTIQKGSLVLMLSFSSLALWSWEMYSSSLPGIIHSVIVGEGRRGGQ